MSSSDGANRGVWGLLPVHAGVCSVLPGGAGQGYQARTGRSLCGDSCTCCSSEYLSFLLFLLLPFYRVGVATYMLPVYRLSHLSPSHLSFLFLLLILLFFLGDSSWRYTLLTYCWNTALLHHRLSLCLLLFFIFHVSCRLWRMKSMYLVSSTLWRCCTPPHWTWPPRTSTDWPSFPLSPVFCVSPRRPFSSPTGTTF